MIRENDPSIAEAVKLLRQGLPIRGSLSLEKMSEINKLLGADPSLSGKLKAFVIIYGTGARNALVMYPDVSPTRLSIFSATRLKPEHFSLILNSPEIIGDILPLSFIERIKEEGQALGSALVIAVIAFMALVLVSNDAAQQYQAYLANPDSTPIVQSVLDFFSTVGQALLTIMTLFLSVFILFTISQNSLLTADLNLYRTGLSHKYIRDDRYIAIVTGFSLLAVLIGLLIAAIPQELVISYTPIINKMNSIIPLLYSLAFAGFVIALLSLSYYAQRVLLANESNLIKNILQEKSIQAADTKKLSDVEHQKAANSV